MWHRLKNDTNELIYKTEIDSQKTNRHRQQTYGYQRGNGGSNKVGV